MVTFGKLSTISCEMRRKKIKVKKETTYFRCRKEVENGTTCTECTEMEWSE